MEHLLDSLLRFQPQGWVAENLKTGEVIIQLYCQRKPPHVALAEALHPCPARKAGDKFLCSCCGLHREGCEGDEP